MPAPGENPALDAETRVPILVGISVAFVTASSIVVALRLYTRQSIIKALGPDDFTITFAQLLSIGVSAATILQAKYALGKHVWMTDGDGAVNQAKSLFAAMVVYNLAQIVTKISFLLMYRRIFTDHATRSTCLWLLMFLIAWGITQEVLVGMACFPVSVFVPSRQDICIDSLTIFYLTSIMNIITDFVIFMVPMKPIWALQLRRKQKIAVASLFCLGFFTCILSIVRLFTLRATVDTKDPTWDNVPTAYWTVVELNCGILCACLPTLRPLLRHLFPNLHKSYGSGYQHDSSIAKSSSSRSHRAYALHEIDTNSSQEVLREDAANGYVAPKFSRHPGNSSKLTTSIQGGQVKKGPTGVGCINGGVGAGSPDLNPQQIRVTREIGVKETTNEKGAS